jgi:8-oxo-dGTP pyrophosphatase MutT (NUDIX family)
MNQSIKIFPATRAFIFYNGKLLLLRESDKYYDGVNSGSWDVPGGRIAPEEDFKSAILREVKEETGLDVEIGWPFSVGEWWPKPHGEEWHIVATFFECFASSDQVVLSQDYNEYQWIDIKDYKNYNHIQTNLPAFEDYIRQHSVKVKPTLRFQPHLAEMVLNGQKNITWRIDDEKGISEGDVLSLCHLNYEEFSQAKVVWVKFTTFGQFTLEDKAGHELFASNEEMYQTYSKYYNQLVGPETKVKVIKFKIIG